MKRSIVIVAVAAVAALGVAVTVGSTHQKRASQTQPPGPTAAPQDRQTPEQLCEQATRRVRAKHPGAYVSGCNSGVGVIITTRDLTPFGAG